MKKRKVHLKASICCTNLSLIHGYPLSCCEPLMIFNVIHSILEVSITLGKVHLKWQKYMIKISKVHKFSTPSRDFVPAVPVFIEIKMHLHLENKKAWP